MMRTKPRLLIAGVILSNLTGNALLSFGLKGGASLWVALSPAVLAGIALLILWMLARAALMSWTDLSYLLPVTAAGYVLTALVGALFLREQVSPLRWGATLLITAGIVLAGTTPPKTT